MSNKEKGPANSSKSKTPVKGKNFLDIINDLLADGRLSLYIDRDEKPFAEISDGGSEKTFCEINSGKFEGWLAAEYVSVMGKFPPRNEKRSAIEHIDYLADENGQTVNVAMRFGEDNGIHYIDMANEAGQVIQITPDGWSIVDASRLSTKFLRLKTMRPLTTVSPGEGDSKRILKYLNMSEEDKMIYQVGLCVTPFVDIERPIICFKGREGSAKTTAARFFRSVFDSCEPMENNCEMTQSELALAFQNNALSYFDNITEIKGKASNMFCQLVTGGAYAKRKHYSNGKLYIQSFKRMALLTAIDMPSNAPDFLDRCIILEMERIENPTSITDLMRQFNEDLPYIRGGFLDTIVKAKKLYPDIRIERLPRLADYGKWGAAVAMALGYDPEMYVNTLIERISTYKLKAVKIQKPLLNAILAYIRDNEDFNGLTSDLLDALKPYKQKNAKGWPNTAIGLEKKLSNLEKDLLELGLPIEIKMNNKFSQVNIRKFSDKSDSNVTEDGELLGQGHSKNVDDREKPTGNTIKTVKPAVDNSKFIIAENIFILCLREEAVKETYLSVFPPQNKKK